MSRFSQQVDSDFSRARMKAFWRDLLAHIQRRPNELLSFEEIRRVLKPHGSTFKGLREVPVRQIIGSATNRYHDFDRVFLPAQTQTGDRWKAIDQAKMDGIELPPVQLYQVGEYYFVRDGHHRVSVARERGEEFIDAEVIRVQTRVPLTGDETELDPRNLEIIGEYADFLDATHLDKILPEVTIRFSEPGGYARLLEHLQVHQYFMGVEQQRAVSLTDAIQDWNANWYQPVVEIIRARDILHEFPGRTEGDLYLWIMDHFYFLQERSDDWNVATAAQDFADKYSPRFSRKIARRFRQLKTR